MIRPDRLEIGDKVAIVAPAKMVDKASIKRAVHVLESWGLRCVFGKHLFSAYHQYAGDDAERLDDLQQMLDNSEIKAVFCARGGYGTIRIADRLDFNLFLKNPKWLVGFSDITVLHAAAAKTGVEAIHGPMPKVFPLQDEFLCLQHLQKILFAYESNIIAETFYLNRSGSVKAALTGGNLSIIYSLLGSATDIDTNGKILFIEDVCEYLYHLDRMLWSLKRAGKFDNLAGLIVGQFSDMKDNDIPFGKNAYEIIAEHIDGYDFPVCYNFPVGHVDNNQAIVIGAQYCLEVDSNISLTLEMK